MNSFNNILALDSSLANHLVITLLTHNQIINKNIIINHLESELIPIIDSLLNECHLKVNDINAFVIGAGPGSFMGLRIGFSVLRTWAWGLDIPIIMISSLELLKYCFIEELRNDVLYIPCIDAKMKRIYTNISSKNQIILADSDIFPEILIQYINELSLKYYSINIIGSGANILKPLINNNKINFYPEIIIQAKVFSKNFLRNIPSIKFKQQSLKNLNEIIPQYLRLSAAEMNQKEKE